MEKGGGDGRTYPPEHHLGGWKPAPTVHDAASAPIELPPFRDHVCPHSSSASPVLSAWLLSASAPSASLMQFVSASVFQQVPQVLL